MGCILITNLYEVNMTTKQKVIKSGSTKKTPKIINQSVENAVAELLSQGNPEDLFGKDGLFQALKKQLVNKILEKEMESHLGYSKHSKDEKDLDNRRNGSYEKTLIDEEGRKVTIDVPRDREGDFEPAIVPKGVRQFKGFDDKVISLYARGMTMREIQEHLEEIYSTKVSAELISKVTDGVLEDIMSLSETLCKYDIIIGPFFINCTSYDLI